MLMFRDEMLAKMSEVMKASNKDMVRRLRAEISGGRIVSNSPKSYLPAVDGPNPFTSPKSLSTQITVGPDPAVTELSSEMDKLRFEIVQKLNNMENTFKRCTDMLDRRQENIQRGL